jgi:hypothetical protein
MPARHPVRWEQRRFITGSDNLQVDVIETEIHDGPDVGIWANLYCQMGFLSVDVWRYGNTEEGVDGEYHEWFDSSSTASERPRPSPQSM